MTKMLLLLLLLATAAHADWLIKRTQDFPPPSLKPSTSPLYPSCSLVFTNGLLTRVFADPSCSNSTHNSKEPPPPNWATIDVLDVTSSLSRSALAAIDVEASVELNGTLFFVGGFLQKCNLYAPENQKVDPFSTCSYLNRSQPNNLYPSSNESSFVFSKYTTTNIEAPFEYTPARHSNVHSVWPPLGLHLAIEFVAPKKFQGTPIEHITITVHYNLLQGIPVMTKWISVETPATAVESSYLQLGNVLVETLRLNDDFAGTSYAIAAPLHEDGASGRPLLFPSVDVPYGASCTWGNRPESTYNSNPYLSCATDGIKSTDDTCHSKARPREVCAGSGVACPDCGQDICPCPTVNIPAGVHVTLRDASSSYFQPRLSNSTNPFYFKSFEVRLLMFDTQNQERRGLAMKRMTSILSPWTTENPLFVHLTNTTTESVKETVDDLNVVGMEMIIQSFGTSFNMENNSESYLKELALQTKYGREKGIEIGGYDLIVLDRGGLGYNEELINQGNQVAGSACEASKWVDHLTPIIQSKVSGGGIQLHHNDEVAAIVVGLGLIETDGPYGGAGCSATNHSHHHGLEDSVYWQTRLQSEFYMSMRAQGISVNAPDRYWSVGANKMMFYGDPTNYGSPRKMDLLLSRQMLFDATYEWLPTQGWSLVPLEPYGGNSDVAAAAFSPLEENVIDYDYAFAMYLGYGVSGVCWRGKKIFEGPKSQAVVTKWVSWYKKYRDTLTSELLIHFRRPDGQNLDGVLHANPRGGKISGENERGIFFVFNPTGRDVETTVSLNLYYTGLTDVAMVREGGGSMVNGTKYVLHRDYTVNFPVSLQAESYAWFVIS